jgi:DNA-binding NtrC family response regulator
MILVVDDDIAVRTSLCLLLKKNGYNAIPAEDPGQAIALVKQQYFDLIIQDMNFSLETSGEEGLKLIKELKALAPQTPIILITAWASVALAVEGMKSGASDFVCKPWSNSQLLNIIETALSLTQTLAKTASHTMDRKELSGLYQFDKIIGEDPQFVAVLETMGRISATDASVLILGESGTGKELIAEAIHQNSKRANRAFVKVNLGGISSSLFESEMFGHKKGAFTDAKNDRVGRFELANRGTIFLDEIGELDMSSQVKLLRILQDRTYEVLGDSRSKTVDVRVISATNRDLSDMVEKGTFREDLFYRLNLITVRLPPLRERPGDIPLLVNTFIEHLKVSYQRPGLQVDKQALKWLKDLPLPGNIRELKNLVERTVLVSRHDRLEITDFATQQAMPKKTNMTAASAAGIATLDQMEETMIRKAMDFYKGNISKVAKSLGLSRATLYRRLEKYNVPYEQE